MAFGVLDFIHADGVDGSQRAVLQAPGDDVFNRVENLVPGSAKGFGCFLPGQLARPPGQKEHVGSGQLALALAPRHFLDYHHAATAAIDPPHGVQEEDEKPPQGDELETPLGKLVITRCRLMTTRADGGRTLTRSHGHFDALVVGAEAGLLVDKTSETVAAV